MRVQPCNKDVAGVMEGGRQLVVKSFKDFSMVSIPRVDFPKQHLSFPVWDVDHWDDLADGGLVPTHLPTHSI